MTHRRYPLHLRAADVSGLKGEEAKWAVEWNPEAGAQRLRIEYGSFKNEMGWVVQSAEQFAELRDWLTRAGSDVFIPLVNAIEQGQTPTDEEFERARDVVERTRARNDAEARRRAMAEANAKIATGRKQRPLDSLVPGFTPTFPPVREPPPLRRSLATAAAVATAGACLGFVAGVMAPMSSKPYRAMLGVGGSVMIGAIVAVVIWHRSTKEP